MSFRFALAYIGPQSIIRSLTQDNPGNQSPSQPTPPYVSPSVLRSEAFVPCHLGSAVTMLCMSLHPRLADFPALSRYVGCIEERWNCHGRNPGDKIVANASDRSWPSASWKEWRLIFWWFAMLGSVHQGFRHFSLVPFAWICLVVRGQAAIALTHNFMFLIKTFLEKCQQWADFALPWACHVVAGRDTVLD